MSATVEAPKPDRQRLVAHLVAKRTDLMEDVMLLNPGIYTDPEVARLERELIFGRVPVVAAHCSEIAEPGSFVTLRLARNEAIVARQEDGSVKAFVNACRHRGSLVEDRENGSCKKFQCPYHGWSYNLDGSLKSATHQVSFGDFDHIRRGLVQLPVDERHGYVWVIDSPDVEIDVASWLGPEMDAILASYNLDRYLCVHSGSFHEDANWKLMHDAFLDGYHIQFVHPDTAAKLTYTNVLTLEDYGRHSRFLSPRKSIDPLLPEWQETGLSDEKLAPHINLSHGLLPNATMLYLPDHVQMLSFFPHPKDPGRCRMDMRLIVPSVADLSWEQGKWDYVWDKNWQINMDILRDEDFPIATKSQRAIESESAGMLTLGRNEIANQVQHRELRRLLSADAA